jgi:hypothetical protein
MLARRFFPLLLLPLAAWALLSGPHPAEAGERHYMIVFGSQSHPKLPRFTHTFATIVRVADGPPDCPAPRIEAYTISWLPRTLVVHPYRCHDEPGVNLTLEATLKWAADNRMHVSEWGPYAIDPEFFWRVYERYAQIESGAYRYKAVDILYRGTRTTDCIHAVSDVDRYHPRGYYDPIVRNGDSASRRFVVALYNRGRLIDAPEAACWLNAALGLDRYPIVHRPDP